MQILPSQLKVFTYDRRAKIKPKYRNFHKSLKFYELMSPPLTDQDQTWHDILYHARFYSDRYIPGGPKKRPELLHGIMQRSR